MKEKQDGKGKDWTYMVIAICLGILVNVLLSFITYSLHLPLYLDTIGTISVAAMGGVFAGILTAVATSFLCSIFNGYAAYYTLVGVLIAGVTTIFVWSGKMREKLQTLEYLLVIAFFGGVLGTFFQWLLLGGPQFSEVAMASERIASVTGLSVFVCSVFVNFVLNLIDKGISAGFASFIYYAVPAKVRESIWNGGWRQTPLDKHASTNLRKRNHGRPESMQKRMTFLITFAAASVALSMSWISINIYFETTKKEYTERAISASEFAADVIDADMVEEYLRKGGKVGGYEETRELLSHIRDNSAGVKYLYVVKIDNNGCHFVFDLDTEDTEAMAPGTMTRIEEAFYPYMPALLEGEPIPAIESNDISGWVLTAYTPVKDSYGKTVCYAAADVSMQFLSGYVLTFLLKTLFIFSGFFILILAYGLWISRYYLIFPVSSMTASTDGFMDDSNDLEKMDEKVKAIKALNIHTGDEVEALYTSICGMASGMAEEMRAVRYYANATAQMQNGLIITMADMVENRDSDTGAHVQKTAAYVRLILEGLKKKGYYAEKLTEKYMSDVEMSAPLHDVGKINIPDAVLNKPGKLTDEEYEIMKTHAEAGKKILENAISTIKGENYLKEARNMAAYHHERWDGKGYPEGLKGEVIPLSARIMAVADVFDALSSPRVYKPAFPLEKALTIIQDGAGTQFDPKCVEVFMDSITEVKIILKKYHGN